MYIYYSTSDGAQHELELGEQAVTIGRSTEADVVIEDDRLSRRHCEIRQEEDQFYIQDLESKNGTYLNGERIESSTRLLPGDRVRIGGTDILATDERTVPGTNTALHQVEEEMADGKGYKTILREIVQTVPPPRKSTPAKPRPDAAQEKD